MTTNLDGPRLIDRAFCLKQASIDSVHEKNVRHGHISTLHIWPARRPLAACRAALVATLLPDPGSKDGRDRLLERLGGKLVRAVKRKRIDGRVDEKEVEETAGGILHWGRESGPDLIWFREQILKAFGGRPPRVLDPFAGGGAIPLEAMRLGCETTAIDINPVAWFILKCTLEYPHQLAGQRRLLPDFAARSPEFMEAFFKATKKRTKHQLAKDLEAVQQNLFPPPEVDLAWHVRAWGHWVLERARADLEKFYPTVDGKPTVAYLWARTVTCKGCRAKLPLLKTRWLCRKDNKRVLLTMQPQSDRSGVEFGIETNVPRVGGNNAQRREHDRKIGAGTMSRSGAQCPCCPVIMTTEDIGLEGQAGRLGALMTAVVVNGPKGKEYRLPFANELAATTAAEGEVEGVFADIPFGLPNEPVPKGGAGASRAFSVDGYGFDRWSKLFTSRQLVALGTFVKHTRVARDVMLSYGYPVAWIEALSCYLAAMLDRLANQSSNVAHWNKNGENVEGTFARFALPIVWDFAELDPLADTTGGYSGAVEWVRLAVAHFLATAIAVPVPHAERGSALSPTASVQDFDLVLTDPPYYDAIPYSDLMDFFHVWLRRTLSGLSTEMDNAFREPLGPKWSPNDEDGELIDDASRFGGDVRRSTKTYEEGMGRAFAACHRALGPSGRMAIVFAHKKPEAWETLVAAMIRAGFVVDGSWPIQTERTARTRSLASAALSSSVWLVCRKRPEDARPGWDNRVLEEMRTNIHAQLREFWDAGIRGPDFVWAATGPALEAYSKHPVVKKANDPGQVLMVSEFLREVRRLVVEFAVGRMLHGDREDEAGGLDDVTLYYLLHRNDFGFDKAPAGACILYAQACGQSEATLVDLDVLIPAGGHRDEEEGEEEDEAAGEDGADFEAGRPDSGGSTSAFKLRRFGERRGRWLGSEVEGRVPPLIDQLHRLMQLWRAGDVNRVNRYLDEQGLRGHPRFHHLVQAVLEMARKQGETAECTLLEAVSNHLVARGPEPGRQPQLLPADPVAPDEDV